nr:MAG TPA: hypothetical protein [Caudoviricetes sp.]
MKGVMDYMALPYTRVVQERHDESGHYFYGKILEYERCYGLHGPAVYTGSSRTA